MVRSKGPPASRTMVCTCNSVTNDQFSRSGPSFINVKDGDGNCSCIINNDKTGSTTKPVKVSSVLLSQRVKRK